MKKAIQKARLAAAVGAIALAFAVTDAVAAVITLDSVTGVWTSTTPVSGISGVGTNEIRWGTPTDDSNKSGYRFDGAAPPPQAVVLETDFNIGNFTHYNFPITGTSLNTAVLQVTSQVSVDGTPFMLVSTFNFTHNETDNDAPCGFPSVSVCDDIVTFAIDTGASTGVNIGGIDYFLSIDGFFVNNVLSNHFQTEEEKVNVAQLRGILTATPGGPGGEEEVPLPPSLTFLGMGLLGIGLMRRRVTLALMPCPRDHIRPRHQW